MKTARRPPSSSNILEEAYHAKYALSARFGHDARVLGAYLMGVQDAMKTAGVKFAQLPSKRRKFSLKH